MARRARKYDGHEVTASIGCFGVLKGSAGLTMKVRTKSGTIVGKCNITQGGMTWIHKHGRKGSATTSVTKRWPEIVKMFSKED